MTMPLTGVVLAGGKSRRLGRNKLVEPLEGAPLIARVIERLRQVCGEIVVVGAEPGAADALPIPDDARTAFDLYPDKGSLGGIYSGLAKATNRWSLVVAGDMPFLNASLIEYMASLADGYDAVVPRVEGRPEPTHALYAKECLTPVHARLERDDLKIARFFEDVRVRFVGEPDVRGFDPDLLSFFNVNTQDDLDRAAALAAERA